MQTRPHAKPVEIDHELLDDLYVEEQILKILSKRNPENIIKINDNVKSYNVKIRNDLVSETITIKEEIADEHQGMVDISAVNTTQTEGENENEQHQDGITQKQELRIKLIANNDYDILQHKHKRQKSANDDLIQHKKQSFVTKSAELVKQTEDVNPKHDWKTPFIVNKSEVASNYFHCDLCNYFNTSEMGLKVHRTRKHHESQGIVQIFGNTNKYIEKEQTEQYTNHKANNTANKLQNIKQRVVLPRCDLCGHTSYTQNLLNYHKKLKHGHPDPEKEKTNEKVAEENKEGISNEVTKDYILPILSEIKTEEISIENEIVSDQYTDLPVILPVIECNVCKHRFSSEKELHTHVNQTHNKPLLELEESSLFQSLKAFKCDRCNYVSSNKNALYQHRYRKHDVVPRKHHTRKQRKALSNQIKESLDNENSTKTSSDEAIKIKNEIISDDDERNQ